MNRVRFVAETDGATFAQLRADPRFVVQSSFEILRDPYGDCRTVLEFIHMFCSENDRETFTRREIIGVAGRKFTDAEIDYQLCKLVYDLQIDRTRHGHYDLALCIYGMNQAA